MWLRLAWLAWLRMDRLSFTWHRLSRLGFASLGFASNGFTKLGLASLAFALLYWRKLDGLLSETGRSINGKNDSINGNSPADFLHF